MPSPPDIIKELAKDMAEHAKTCWMRPGYHFLPLNGWMNDPNGTVFFNGHYHLFYQKNPWQETWGYMHWGHARSSDLVYWKRLPIAFGPSYDKGEDHCYSGGAVNNDGVLTTVYTSISENRPPEQWAAISRDGVNFEKIPENPIMTMKLHGEDEKRTDNWRDPYLWREPGEETWHCVVGGQLVDEGDARKKNITPTAFHYLSKDLINWKYIGPLIQGLHDEVPENHHNKDWRIPNFECPNFFPLEPSNPDNRTYCFMCAPHDRILYNVGQYIKSDSGYKFTPTRWRVFDMGKPFYATNTWINEGRTVLIGWLRVKGESGWNGAQSLPRELSARPDGRMRQVPVKELECLRKDHLAVEHMVINPPSDGKHEQDLSSVLDDECNTQLISLLGKSERQVEIKLSITEWPENFELWFYPEGADKENPIAGIFGIDKKDGILYLGWENGSFGLLPEEKELNLHIFLDNSIIEVFINERIAITSTIRPNPETIPQLAFHFVEGKLMIKSCEIWALEGIW